METERYKINCNYSRVWIGLCSKPQPAGTYSIYHHESDPIGGRRVILRTSIGTEHVFNPDQTLLHIERDPYQGEVFSRNWWQKFNLSEWENWTEQDHLNCGPGSPLESDKVYLNYF